MCWRISESAIAHGQALEAEWSARMEAYKTFSPLKSAELERRLAGRLPDDWKSDLPVFPADAKGMATRIASGKTINASGSQNPRADWRFGRPGAFDQRPGWTDFPAFEPESPDGRNFHFGVREHAMGAIVNGMAVHGGVIPFGATFLAFSDYMREPIRLSALSHFPSIWVFTHDSIGVGEDGPTHQPVEQLASLRAIPHLTVIRPADANETVIAWKHAIENRHAPTLLALTRQNVPTIGPQPVRSGGWAGARRVHSG